MQQRSLNQAKKQAMLNVQNRQNCTAALSAEQKHLAYKDRSSCKAMLSSAQL
jgi:hypothetical protein